MNFPERIIAMTEIALARPVVSCSARACKRRGSYLCRGCGKGYCGHHGPHRIAPDERIDRSLWMTCVCHKCAKK